MAERDVMRPGVGWVRMRQSLARALNYSLGVAAMVFVGPET